MPEAGLEPARIDCISRGYEYTCGIEWPLLGWLQCADTGPDANSANDQPEYQPRSGDLILAPKAIVEDHRPCGNHSDLFDYPGQLPDVFFD